jgi:hypothetical protein
MPNDDTRTALSRRGATLWSRISPTVITFSIASLGVMPRPGNVALWGWLGFAWRLAGLGWRARSKDQGDGQ